MCVRNGAIFAAGSLTIRAKMASLQIFRPKSAGFQENLEGVVSAGGLSARKTAQCAVFSENGSADPWALAPPSDRNYSVAD